MRQIIMVRGGRGEFELVGDWMNRHVEGQALWCGLEFKSGAGAVILDGYPAVTYFTVPFNQEY